MGGRRRAAAARVVSDTATGSSLLPVASPGNRFRRRTAPLAIVKSFLYISAHTICDFP